MAKGQHSEAEIIGSLKELEAGRWFRWMHTFHRKTRAPYQSIWRE